MGNCRLCLEEKELVRAHIIPDALIRDLRSSPGEKLILSSTGGRIRPGKRPTGLYDPEILCGPCDSWIGREYEDYSIKVLRGEADAEVVEDGERLVISRIDYRRFKLFFLAILWRAHVSSLPEFHDIDLGSDAEEIGRMLHDGDPGRAVKYGVIGVWLGHENLMSQAVWYPCPLTLGRFKAFEITFCRFRWWILLDSDCQDFEYKDWLLREGGVMWIERSNVEIRQGILRDCVSAEHNWSLRQK